MDSLLSKVHVARQLSATSSCSISCTIHSSTMLLSHLYVSLADTRLTTHLLHSKAGRTLLMFVRQQLTKACVRHLRRSITVLLPVVDHSGSSVRLPEPLAEEELPAPPKAVSSAAPSPRERRSTLLCVCLNSFDCCSAHDSKQKKTTSACQERAAS